MPRVLVLGASRFNVPVIRAIGEAGFFTVVADGNATAPALRNGDASVVADIRSAEAVRAAAHEHRVDGIVTLGEAGVRAAATACEALGLPTIPLEVAINATSKVNMRRCWDTIPQYSVPWRLAHDLDGAVAAADAIGGFPVIVKPDRTHGGSRGVMRADDRAQLAEAFAFARHSGFSPDVIVEHFIRSRSEYSAEVLIHDGDVSVIAVGEKVKTAGAYRVDLSVQYPAEIDVHEMCAAAVNAIGLTRGAAHIEFAMTDDGPVLLELGARSGGGHTPLLARHVSGVDEIAELCRIACGMAPKSFRPVARRGGEFRFLTFPAGTLAEAIVPEEIRSHPGVLDVEVLVPPGGALREIQTGADRAGFVVTVGDTRHEAVRIAGWATSLVRVRYADGEVRQAL